MIKKILIENQGLAFSVMVFILVSFVIVLLIWLRKIAQENNVVSIGEGQAVLGKHLKAELKKIPELVKENKKFKEQIENLAIDLQKELEERNKDKMNLDEKKEGEKDKTKESLNLLIKKIAAMDVSQKDSNTQLETIQNRVEDMNEEINNIEVQEKSIGEKDNKDNKENKELFVSLKQNIDKFRQELNANQKQMENWYRVFESMDADLVEINNRIKGLEEKNN